MDRFILSRVKSSSQCYLLGDYNSAGIKADPRVAEEYDRLRVLTLMTKSVEFDAPNIICDSKPNNIVLSLLNIRSLEKHCVDIKK